MRPIGTPSIARRASALLLLLVLAALPARAATVVFSVQESAKTISRSLPDGTTAVWATGLTGSPGGITADAAGNLYLGYSGNINRYTPAGVASVYATLNQPGVLTQPAFGPAGELYVGSYTNGVVYRIAPGGGSGSAVVTTFATGVTGCEGVAVDAAGNVYAAESPGTHLYKITPQGTMTTFYTGLNGARNITLDPAGNVYVAQWDTTASVLKISPAGVATPLVTGLAPWGITLDAASGDLFITAGLNGASAVQRVSPAGVVTPVATGLNFTEGLVAIPEPTSAALATATVTLLGRRRPRRR